MQHATDVSQTTETVKGEHVTAVFHVAQLHSNLKMKMGLVHPEQKPPVSQSVTQPCKPYLHTQFLSSFQQNSLHAWTVKRRAL